MSAIISILLVSMFLIVVGGLAVMAVAKNLVYIAGPNEVLIFSGRKTRVGARKWIGYRTIKGGRGFRIPLIEAVDRLDLTNMVIDVSVSNAYSKGGIPLKVQGVANVKIAGHEPLLGNAVERFLGRDRRSIIKVAKDTLEGNLRGVLSQLTPEQVNEDKLRFAEKLLEEAEHDLSRLGLTLDTLKIQNVADDVGYLDSIGRKRTAEVIRNARVNEAAARAQSTQREAENHQLARVRDIEAEMKVLMADVDRQITDANTAGQAMIAEEIGAVGALIAEAEENIKVQDARVEQVARRLLADVVAPAQAQMQQRQADAQAQAARIIEDGKAKVAVLDAMITTWQAGGDSARDIFLMQKLQVMMDSLVNTITDVKINRVTILPSSDNSTAKKSVTLVEELKAGTGIDIPLVVERLTGGAAPRGNDG
jgi:flotillin